MAPANSCSVVSDGDGARATSRGNVKGETFIGSWLVICYDDAIEEYLLARKLSGEDDGTMAEFREAYEKHGGARFSRKTTTTRTGTVDRMACSHISNRLPL